MGRGKASEGGNEDASWVGVRMSGCTAVCCGPGGKVARWQGGLAPPTRRQAGWLAPPTGRQAGRLAGWLTGALQANDYRHAVLHRLASHLGTVGDLAGLQ